MHVHARHCWRNAATDARKSRLQLRSSMTDPHATLRNYYASRNLRSTCHANVMHASHAHLKMASSVRSVFLLLNNCFNSRQDTTLSDYHSIITGEVLFLLHYVYTL